MKCRSIKAGFILSAAFCIISTITGCQQLNAGTKTDFELQQGDLLFQDLDCGALCDAIEKVTSGYHGANFSHVGIAAKSKDDGMVVIEAVQKGVAVTPLEIFLARSVDEKGMPKVMAGRLKPAYQGLVPSAVENAFALRGKPYDKVFEIGNEAYYCSELIYEIFLRANNNKPVFELSPMTFKDRVTGKTMAVWQEYFEKLDAAVPEGKPGINPGGISRCDKLIVIKVYGKPAGLRDF